MKKETYKTCETVEINRTRYVADDGTVFFDEYDCLRYEDNLPSQLLKFGVNNLNLRADSDYKEHYNLSFLITYYENYKTKFIKVVQMLLDSDIRVKERDIEDECYFEIGKELYLDYNGEYTDIDDYPKEQIDKVKNDIANYKYENGRTYGIKITRHYNNDTWDCWMECDITPLDLEIRVARYESGYFAYIPGTKPKYDIYNSIDVKGDKKKITKIDFINNDWKYTFDDGTSLYEEYWLISSIV